MQTYKDSQEKLGQVISFTSTNCKGTKAGLRCSHRALLHTHSPSPQGLPRCCPTCPNKELPHTSRSVLNLSLVLPVPEAEQSFSQWESAQTPQILGRHAEAGGISSPPGNVGIQLLSQMGSYNLGRCQAVLYSEETRNLT